MTVPGLANCISMPAGARQSLQLPQCTRSAARVLTPSVSIRQLVRVADRYEDLVRGLRVDAADCDAAGVPVASSWSQSCSVITRLRPHRSRGSSKNCCCQISLTTYSVSVLCPENGKLIAKPTTGLRFGRLAGQWVL